MKTYEKIYQVLSQADDFVTGEVLGRDLGISRTAVWKAIQTLESKGIVIESVKNRGYRLLSGDLFLPDEIEQMTGIKVFFNEKSSSTQLDAKALKKGILLLLFILRLVRQLLRGVLVGSFLLLKLEAFICLYIFTLNCLLSSYLLIL